jgi:hypothetical protein
MKFGLIYSKTEIRGSFTSVKRRPGIKSGFVIIDGIREENGMEKSES